MKSYQFGNIEKNLKEVLFRLTKKNSANKKKIYMYGILLPKQNFVSLKKTSFKFFSMFPSWQDFKLCWLLIRKICFKFLKISILWPLTFYSDPALAYCAPPIPEGWKNYLRVLIISYLISDSAWDPKNLVSCNRNTDCPKGLGWETACHRMLSPTPTGQSGYCVPLACESEIQCPSLGNECQEGSISGHCNLATSTCDYDRALAIATCVSY